MLKTANSVLPFRLLGSFQVTIGSEPLPATRSKYGRLLLSYLAAKHGQSVERTHLAELFWDDSDTEHQSDSLRACLKDLRLVLGNWSNCLISHSGLLGLNTANISVDCVAFEQAVRSGELAEIRCAVEQYGGQFLEGWEGKAGSEWQTFVLDGRKRYTLLYRRAVLALFENAMSEGDFAEARHWLGCLLHNDARHTKFVEETLWQRLMTNLVQNGDFYAARRVYRELKEFLHCYLHAVPKEQTQAIYKALPPLRKLPKPLEETQDETNWTFWERKLNHAHEYPFSEIVFQEWGVAGTLIAVRDNLRDFLVQNKPIKPRFRPYAYTTLARLCIATGEHEQGRRCAEQALTLFEEQRNRIGLSAAFGMLSYSAYQSHKFQDALTYQEQNLAILTELDNIAELANCFCMMGDCTCRLEQYQSASDWYGKALSIAEERGDKRFATTIYSTLGWMASAQGDYSTVEKWRHHAVDLAREHGDLDMLAFALAHYGALAIDHHDLETARTLLAESLEHYAELQHQTGMRGVFFSLARMEAASVSAIRSHSQQIRRAKRSARLWGVVIQYHAAQCLPLPPFPLLSLLHEMLGEEESTAAVSEGNAMMCDEALAYGRDGRR